MPRVYLEELRRTIDFTEDDLALARMALQDGLDRNTAARLLRDEFQVTLERAIGAIYHAQKFP